DAGTGEKLIVSGIVAGITYANGKVPSGVILVDGADSIYVYSNDLAGRVKVGSRVEVAASKTYWILEDEQYSAAAHGYKGCNQLEDVTVISVTDGADDWVNSAIPTTTIKEIMDNPVSNDITTQIYKANALVKKVPGSSFVNYYLNDLDEATGSYVYTQCNGSDFAWVDAFDGKICTVYFVVINAKSTATGCVYRFVPVKIVDENYTFNTDGAAEFVAKYHGAPQFEASYTGNPALELKTSVSSALLGFENATLSYASSDESVINIEVVDGKTIMNCLKSGTVTINVTGAYGEKTYDSTVTITVDIPTEEIPSVNVKAAIDAAIGKEVTVKGIVGPCHAGTQNGFYLIDESAVIAVRVADSSVLSTLKIGDEIIIKGTKKLSKETDGQIVIDSAEILQNNYGSHAYSTTSFITGKTVADVVALNGDISHTVEVYVVTATISQTATQWSSNTYVTDGSNQFMLYAGGKEYNWLADYVGQTLTIELAVCDWNAKGNKGCILSITTADGTQIFNDYKFK
ncbi:MAG: OB-fold nucleic acid binding domain-containing protein, partial [Clostridia bacterium]|nr:OB-fold nucleic acid binding domain-containing protein [Clostridia bacterium]